MSADEPPSALEREALMTTWMQKRGLRPSRSRDWQALCGKRRRPWEWEPLPGQDHERLFCRNGKAEVFTFQPYGLGWETLRNLVKECEEHGLEASISAWPAWHYPGSVLFVEIKRAGGAVVQ